MLSRLLLQELWWICFLFLIEENDIEQRFTNRWSCPNTECEQELPVSPHTRGEAGDDQQQSYQSEQQERCEATDKPTSFLEYAVPSRLDYAVRQHEVNSW